VPTSTVTPSRALRHRTLRPGGHVVDRPLVDVALQHGVEGLRNLGELGLGEVDGGLAQAGVLPPRLRPVLAPLLPAEEGLDGPFGAHLLQYVDRY